MVEIRPTTWDDFDEYFSAMAGPFAFTLPPEGEKRDAWRERFRSYSSMERNFVAVDGDRVVGTLGVFDLDLTVPGGTLSCAGTTGVTVTATHRRQGLLRRMMQAHLDEAMEHGDPVAALWASESSIYQRFGFGLAAHELRLDIDRQHVGFRNDAPTPAPARFVDLEEAEALLPPVYDRVRRELPGAFGRTESWWKHRRLRDEPEQRDGWSDLRTIVTESADGAVDGYAQIRIKQGWGDAHADHTVRVVELFGTSPESWAGIWQAALGHDLATNVIAAHRPLDEPLLDLLVAPRRAAATLNDNLWVRVLDVEAAMTSRSYASAGSMTFELSDRMGLTQGTWRLETDGTSSSCVRTDGAPDLRMDVEALGASLLGRPRFAELARVGRVEGAQEAAIAADRLLHHHRAPVCPEVF